MESKTFSNSLDSYYVAGQIDGFQSSTLDCDGFRTKSHMADSLTPRECSRQSPLSERVLTGPRDVELRVVCGLWSTRRILPISSLCVGM